MLVLTRKLNQEILIGDNVKITVLKVKGNTVRLGIEAPRDVRIVRGELPIEQVKIEQESRSEDLQDDVREDVQANITVMFSDHVEHTSATTTDPDSRMSILEQSSPVLTVQYRDRIPPALSENRLRQIAEQLKDNRNNVT